MSGEEGIKRSPLIVFADIECGVLAIYTLGYSIGVSIVCIAFVF